MSEIKYIIEKPMQEYFLMNEKIYVILRINL